LRIRRSTGPGFPSPGSFPSQRFSRSQGFTPSRSLVGLFHPTNALGVRRESRSGNAPEGVLPLWWSHPSGFWRRPEGRNRRPDQALVRHPEGILTAARPMGPREGASCACLGRTRRSSCQHCSLDDQNLVVPELPSTTPVTRCCPLADWTAWYPKAPIGPHGLRAAKELRGPEGSVSFFEVPDIHRQVTSRSQCSAHWYGSSRGKPRPKVHRTAQGREPEGPKPRGLRPTKRHPISEGPTRPAGSRSEQAPSGRQPVVPCR
jgi:hypothetical protein